MDTAFLLSAILFGWLAYNLYHPVYLQPQIAALSFVLGWLTGELALHHILLQATLFFLFVWAGAVDGFSGAIGFSIYASTWVCMVNFYLSGYHARETVDNALINTLGQDYLSEIPEEIRTRLDDTPDFKQIKSPYKNIAPEVEVLKNIPFGQHRQKLDLYRLRIAPITLEPSSDSKTVLPVLLQIHGGAWTEKMGSKNEQALPLMNYMAQRNWICVSIDYRLSPQATFPEHIIDCKQGLAWVKTHIHEYGGDPNFIVVTGGSAGGHLSSLLALTPNDPNFQPGFEDIDTTVQGAVPFYGVYDFTNTHDLQHNQGLLSMLEGSVLKKPLAEHREDFEAASPIFRITHSAPPFFIIQGDKDTLVPVEEARIFAQQLKNTSENPVAYAEIQGAQHAFDMFASIRSEFVKQGVARFLTFLHAKHQSNRH